MEKVPKKGDAVSWKASQGETKGKVVKAMRSDESVAVGSGQKRQVKATKENPKVLVESEKTGKRAVHSARALKKSS